ncbi:hypothetical protein QWY81_00505 [Polaribacter undariae]|uniref:Uncharacterized protein n=1 Tax=Polaribacter sejongensis TaxID=985043 RepID=A0AAJ1QU69_9FLAO|nr:hypothetical protein [Polaribacter undariae]MDN3617928.1 hypothetical protein [Polaribacter undariae]UWD32040.1 hypothetical protein NQP51_18160 [Polaribacter undariae]
MQIDNEQTENQIIQKRSLNEVKRWMLELNEISQVCNDFEMNSLGGDHLSKEVSTILENNKMIHNTLLEYKNVLDNPTECIDLACDLFFYKEHKKNRNLFIEHFNDYKKLKKEYDLI